MKGMTMEENKSNLTCASGEISASSGSRVETGSAIYPTNQAPPPTKKKRNLPGNPDPDAEVVALSPKSLLSTNRFICEICNKGFQRDQNLQLHRRGHNLPWKLKQRTNKEVRKKVYVCPEVTCVHHDPSRALGDLTGIKKHFCRKHGEKKWKCEKCSKRYAVQSDWKAHSKICGTREYRCDCGTLFSRRDSFITHRAFCDALAEEGARVITLNPLLSSQQQQQPGSSSASNLMNLQVLPIKREQESQHLFNPRSDNNITPWLSCPTIETGSASSTQINLSSQLFPTALDHSLLQHENPSPNPNPTLPPFHPTAAASPHMSATALLQKAAQMGVTMSNQPSPSPAPSFRPHQAHMSSYENTATAFSSSTSVATSTAGSGLNLSSYEKMVSGFGPRLASFRSTKAAVTSAANNNTMDNIGEGAGGPSSPLVHDIMMSPFPSFDEDFNGMLSTSKRDNNCQQTNSLYSKSIDQFQMFSSSDHPAATSAVASHGHGAGGNDGLTRDFLGLKAFSRKDFLNIPGFDHLNPSSSTFGHHNQNRSPW